MSVIVDINPDEAGVFDLVYQHRTDTESTPDGMPFSDWIVLAKEIQMLVPVNTRCSPGYKYRYRMEGNIRVIIVTGYPLGQNEDPVEWKVYLNVKE